jgi:hypothetical protein
MDDFKSFILSQLFVKDAFFLPELRTEISAQLWLKYNTFSTLHQEPTHSHFLVFLLLQITPWGVKTQAFCGPRMSRSAKMHFLKIFFLLPCPI